MSLRTTLSLAGTCIGLALLGAACPADSNVVTKSAAEHGAALFIDPAISGTTYNQMSCSLCHDVHAGDSGLNKPGAPMAGVLERPTYWAGQEDTLLGAINACLYYHMLANDPWDGTEEEAKAIYAFLEVEEASASAEEKQAFSFTVGPVSAPETGDKTRGEALYTSTCGACHGAKNTGALRQVKVAPVLPDQTLKAHPPPMYSDADRRLIFVEKTRHGGFLGYGGQMPPISEETLSDQDLGDVLTYLEVP